MILILLFSLFSQAELDKASQEAVKQTQALMVNPKKRNEALSKMKEAKVVDQNVDDLVGETGKKEDIYRLASEAFEKIAKDAQGDPIKMQELLNEAQKNPEGFYKKMLSPSQQGQVRNIAEEIERTKPKTPAPPQK